MNEYHHLTVPEALAAAQTTKDGLTDREAEARLAQVGLNELVKAKDGKVLALLLDQFTNFLTLLLVFAVVLAFILGETVDAIAMLCIIALSVILGFVQEYRAEKAIEALERIASPTARVLRDGLEAKIPARQLVPGDILVLEEGEIVPADARIIEVAELSIDESSLTGESVPSKKVTAAYTKGTPLADQENMAFMSSVVTYGKGKAVVVGTGMRTEIGAIATSLQETKAVSTPLQRKFEQMSKQIGLAVLGLVLIVFLSGIFKAHISWDKMFFFALALAVAAVPSALAAIVTISLALGARVLATKNMIIKKLPAAESLGAVTVICSDKTGTLTKNQMTVTKIWFEEQELDVSGAGYAPEGEFAMKGKPLSAAQKARLELALRIGSLCNSAKVHKGDRGWECIGDPTEGSLIVLAKKAGLHEEALVERHEFVYELPFDSNRKLMSVIFDERTSGKRFVYAKGAPDQMLQRCTHILGRSGKARRITAKDKERIMAQNDAFAKDALRVLALAYGLVDRRKAGAGKAKFTIEGTERNLVFAGLVGMIDPPREEVPSAVRRCKEAGIKVIVITGDQAITAEAVARRIGLLEEGDLVLTGSELDKLSDAQLLEQIDSVRIIARALPIQKLRIVEALQKRGHTVAMTGDGVNDAPAIKKADVGIAMGITGTDVAKEVAQTILVDDNFASIVSAIAEGRNIYDKILKSTRYLLSCNMGEITSVFVAIVLSFPLPMLPLQILLMNLVTDGLPAMGLGMESPDDDVMQRPPRDPAEHPLSGQMLFVILLFGLIMGAGSIYLFSLYYLSDLPHAQSIAFTSLVMFEMFATIGGRSLKPFHKVNIFTNKWLTAGVLTSIAIQCGVIYIPALQSVFGTVALTLKDWVWIIATSFSGFIIMEITKFIPHKVAPRFQQRRKERKAAREAQAPSSVPAGPGPTPIPAS